MKCRILLVAACVLMFCGCVQEDAKDLTTTTMRTTTTYYQTTSSTTTTTSTTTTAVQATTSTTTTACSTTTTTTMPWDRNCVEYCTKTGYLSGSCQVNRLECQRRLMEAAEYRGELCADKRFDYCCCKNNKSIDRDTIFTLDTIENKYLQ